MSEQSTALRLAGYWVAKNDQGEYLYSSLRFREETAAELRRLYEAHDWQYKMAGDRLRRIEKLEALNQELLKALKLAVRQNEHDMLMTGEELRICLAAITKAKGQA